MARRAPRTTSDPHTTRRTDPGRRDRIIDVCIDVIAESGVAGVSHRKVAAAADVPLGSMTYHFKGMDDLLFEAFNRHASTNVVAFEKRMAEATDPDSARGAVADIIFGAVRGDPRELVLSHELYTLAARDPRFRDITNAWMARSRAALERHFDPDTARALDALIEGLTIHCSLDREPCTRASIFTAIQRATR